MKKYQLTEEHRAQLKPWAERWIANAMSTKPMDDHEREVCRDAVKRLYAAAGLKEPRVVFAPSPFVVRFAGGFAAAIWHLRKATYSATRDATYDATYAATRDATHAATYAATRAATDNATDNATRDATYDATYAATRDATYAATRDATHAATYAATYAATRDATYAATRDATDDEIEKWFTLSGIPELVAARFGIGKFGIECAKNAWQMWQGGNQWSSWVGFLSFFRHVAKLEIDYSKWDAWETLAIHSGPRVVHPEFCIISDRPEILTVDDQNRPHNDNGPFCKWRDGSALYAVHGVRVPSFLFTHPERLTVARIESEQNAEVRRIMMERYGWGRFLMDSGAKEIDKSTDPSGRSIVLYRKDVPGDEPLVMIDVTNATPEPDGHYKQYQIRVRPTMTNAREALASTFNMTAEEYYEMAAES